MRMWAQIALCAKLETCVYMGLFWRQQKLCQWDMGLFLWDVFITNLALFIANSALLIQQVWSYIWLFSYNRSLNTNLALLLGCMPLLFTNLALLIQQVYTDAYAIRIVRTWNVLPHRPLLIPDYGCFRGIHGSFVGICGAFDSNRCEEMTKRSKLCTDPGNVLPNRPLLIQVWGSYG